MLRDALTPAQLAMLAQIVNSQNHFTIINTTPWYKTWWGIGLIAVGGVGAMYFYKHRKGA